MNIYNSNINFLIRDIDSISYDYAYSKIIRPYLSKLNIKKIDVLSFIKYLKRYIVKYNKYPDSNIAKKYNFSNYINLHSIINSEFDIIYKKNGFSLNLLRNIRSNLISITIDNWINYNKLDKYDYIYVMTREKFISKIMMYADSVYSNYTINSSYIVDLFILFFFLYRFPGYFEATYYNQQLTSINNQIPQIPDFYDIMIFAKKNEIIDIISPNPKCLNVVYDIKDSIIINNYTIDKFLIEYNYFQDSNIPEDNFVSVFSKENNIIKHSFNNYIKRGNTFDY